MNGVVQETDSSVNGKWTKEEHQRFLEAIEKYGNYWKFVEAYVGTRSCPQIRSHAQKYFRGLRNAAYRELKESNQLKDKVFIVTKEYFNYSATSPPDLFASQSLPPVPAPAPSSAPSSSLAPNSSLSPDKELLSESSANCGNSAVSQDEESRGLPGLAYPFCYLPNEDADQVPGFDFGAHSEDLGFLQTLEGANDSKEKQFLFAHQRHDEQLPNISENESLVELEPPLLTKVRYDP